MQVESEDYYVAAAMLETGGGFVRRLGELWHAGDPDNRERLKAAFPDYWKRYTDVAEQMKANSHTHKGPIFHVWAEAVGNGTGANWPNAMTQLPAVLVKGAIYMVKG